MGLTALGRKRWSPVNIDLCLCQSAVLHVHGRRGREKMGRLYRNENLVLLQGDGGGFTA